MAIKFDKLTPFYFYRTTKNIYLTSTGKDPKKNLLVSVLSPSIEEEINFLDSITDIFHLRYTYRYFIEKITKITLYPSTIKKLNNSVVDTQKQFASKTNLNISQIDKFIVHNTQLEKCPDLKSFNTIYEFNHALQMFMYNDSDKRTPSKKRDSYYELLKEYMVDYLKNPIFADHTDKVLFIPINQWLDFSSYKSKSIFQSTNGNYLMMLYNVLLNDPTKLEEFRGWKFVLSNYNEFMIFDIAKYLDDKKKEKPDYLNLKDYFRNFLFLCKSNKGHISTDLSEDGINQNMTEAEIDSIAHSETEKILEKSNIDKSKLTDKEIEDLEKTVKEKLIAGDNIVADVELTKTDDINQLTKNIQAKLSNTSIESMQRNEMLNEKYKSTTIERAGNSKDIKPVEDSAKNKLEPLKIKAHLANKELETIKSAQIYEEYINKYYYEHLLMILHHFAGCSPRMFMLENLKEEDISDNMNKVFRYSVTFESEDRSRHNMKFLLPKFYQDRYLFLNSGKKDITMQKFPYTITKTAENMTQLVGNYKKIFIERYGANINPKITRLIKFLNTVKHSKISLIKGSSSSENARYLLPLEFDELSKNFYTMKIGDLKILFNINAAIMEMGSYKGDSENVNYLPFAKSTKNTYYIKLDTEDVVDQHGTSHGNVSDFISSNITSLDKSVEEKFKELSIGKKFMYSRAIIMSFKVPVILLAASLNKDGLIGVLDRAKINYNFDTKRSKVDKDLIGTIKFQDGYLNYERFPFSNSLLIEGLNEVPTEEFSFDSFRDRETYLDVFDNMYGKRNLIEAFENFRQLFVDPITLQIQQRLNGPTDFEGILLMGSDLLVDNKFRLESSYEQSRVRGPEVILVYLYQALAEAYGKHRIDPKNNKFTIPEDAVIKLLMKSQLIDEHSSANTILELENDRRIKSKGPVGLNVDQAYTLDKRAFHPTMRGIVCLSTAVSGEVGITRQVSMNANIIDPLGFLELSKEAKDMDGSELVGAAELINTFSIESAEANRSMMTTGQNKHLVPTERMTEPLISTDFERVIPHLTKDYAYSAKKDGKVISIDEGIMFIQYKDGTKDDIDLNEVPYKHTNAGKYHMNNKITDLKAGSSFKEGDILAYDPKQFKTDLFGDVVAKNGTLGLAAFVCNGSTFEDSTYVLESLTKDLTTKSTVKRDVVVTPFTNIKKFAKKGESVEVNDYLLIFDEADDEFSANLISQAEESEDADDIHFGSKPVKSKVRGVIKDVKVYYTVPFETLTPSMQKFIKHIAKYESDKEKAIKKHIDIKDSQTITSPVQLTVPDSLGRIKGIKVDDGVLIEYYVEYTDRYGVGDKITFNSAVKGTCNNVIPDKYAAFTESNPDEPIQVFASVIGTFKRMVLDIFKIGIGNKILLQAKKDFISQFGEEIENYGKK